MFSLKNLIKSKAHTITVSKTQKELLEMLMINKSDFDEWAARQEKSKIRFQFFYPTAMSLFYDEFKLFNADFKRNEKDELVLRALKMSETNYNTIRSASWSPFETVIIDFLTSLEEHKKIALFEKRKTLFEYQSLCTKNTGQSAAENDYMKQASTPLQMLKPAP